MGDPTSSADDCTIINVNNSGDQTLARGNSMVQQESKLVGPEGNWLTINEILDPNKPYLRRWNMIFAISCVLAVLLDPLFLYLPIINNETKCILLDQNLEIAAVALRAITDLVYIVKIIFQFFKLITVNPPVIAKGNPESESTVAGPLAHSKVKPWIRLWESHIIAHILAVLPFPQVLIVILFKRMMGSESLSVSKLMNFLVLIQYVPRVFCIYLACKETSPSRNTKKSIKAELWLKGGLNFLLYILASHVFGSFWYFLSVQRMISCWHYACRSDSGCELTTFECHNQQRHNINTSLLNDACPISPENSEQFDFGIFLGALQPGIAGSKYYSQKLSNCFWWGLRHLSSLGSNLEPSINTWENLFAVSVSVIGLLLFLYLIGNIQIYMQWKTASLVEKNMKDERKNKIEKKKGREVESWLARNGLPKHFKQEIMENVIKGELEDFEVDNILHYMPIQLRNHIERYLQKMVERGQHIDKCLSDNLLPLDLKSKILEKVVLVEVEQTRYVHVYNILVNLLKRLDILMKRNIRKIEEEGLDIDLRLSDNGISLQTEILENLQQELDREMHVDMKYILPIILPSYIECSLQKRKAIQKMEQKGIQSWYSNNYISKPKQLEVMRKIVQLQVEKNIDVELEDIFSILPFQLQSDIKSFTKKMNEKAAEVDSWMYINGISVHKRSEIIEHVQQQLEAENDVDVQNMLHIFPRNLQGDITSCVIEMKDKRQRIHAWSEQRAIPMHKRPEIMEKVLEELHEGRYVDMENILGILSPDLKICLEGFIQNVEKKDQQIHKWLSDKHIDMKRKPEIMKYVRQELQEGRDFDVQNILSILPDGIKFYINHFLTKIEEKEKEVSDWLFQNGIPLHKSSEIMQRVRQKIQLEDDVDVDNMLYIFPQQLRSYIRSSMKKMKDKAGEVDLWLSQNGYPKNIKSQVMDTVRRELQADKDVNVSDMFTLLPIQITSQIISFMQKMKEKNEEVDLWLSNNRLPIGKKSDIMARVREELERGRDVDVSKISNILPYGLKDDLESFLSNIKKQDPVVDFWLFDNGIPVHIKPRIMEKIREELEKGKKVDVKDILSILTPNLEIYIRGCIQKTEEKCQEVLLWLSQNSFLTHRKNEILERVRKEHQEGREVYVNDLFDILPSELQIFLKKFKQKMEEKRGEVDVWLSKNGIPVQRKSEIMQKVQQELEEGREVNIENFISILPSELQNYINSCMPLTRVKNVPLVGRMNDEVLKAISECLVPKTFRRQRNIIIRKDDDRLKEMIFIVEGTVTIKRRNVEFERSAGEFLGERLLLWPSSSGFPRTKTPLASECARASTDVEALVLKASDLKRVGIEFKSQWTPQHEPLTMIKNVPKLNTMDEEALREICEHLELKTLVNGEYLIYEKDPLEMMFFLVSGHVKLLDRDDEVQDHRNKPGQFYGEEVVDWASSTSSADAPISRFHARSSGISEILVLKANSLKTVFSKFMSPNDD